MGHFLIAAVMMLTEGMHGFALLFLTLFTAVDIFGRKFRRGLLIPVLSGVFLALLALFFLLRSGVVDMTVCLALGMPPSLIAAWLVYTDRKAVSLMSLILAMIFTESMIFAMGNIIGTVAANLAPRSMMAVIQIISLILTYAASILYMKLLNRMAGDSVREPLSIADTALITVPVLIITMLSQDGYSFEAMSEDADISQIIISSVILLCISFFAVFMIKTNQNKYLEKINHLNEEYLNIQSRHFETAKKNDTAIRKLNHDMRNHVFCLGELYREGKFDELGKYIEEMSRAVSSAQPAVKTGSGIADAIIAEKKAAAERYNVSVKVSGTFGGINISAYELCTVLANLMDNAVEAASYFCVKHRWIEVSCMASGNFTVLTVRNVTAEAVDVKSPMRTIKHDKAAHGFGLGNVRSAVERVGGDMMLSCEPYEGEFIFTAEVFLPTNNT